MKTVALLLLTLVIGIGAHAQESNSKRPRDAYQVPIQIKLERADHAIAAIKSFKAILATKDFEKFYVECAHSALKKRVSAERFKGQMAGVADALGQFFDDVLTAYASKGIKDADFQIGDMPYPLITGTIIIQFADRIDAQPKLRWPNGQPLRIQIAPDGGKMRFYDID